MLRANNKDIKKSNILIMGYTFKENCPDTRNTKIRDLALYLNKTIKKIDIFDPWIRNINHFSKTSSINFTNKPKKNFYDGIILTVGHSQFKKMGLKKIKNFGKKNLVIYDFKKLF